MKRIILLSITMVMVFNTLLGQEFDLTFTSSESGTKTHQARNSITFGPNYSYTPSGGTMTAEIVNPIVEGTVSYGSIIDPETRSLNASYEVGTTTGTFNVNALGGATYTIPLEVPPGIGGFAPSLSLNYSSLAGRGVAGYGWNIGSISVITRSPQNYYHDGYANYVGLSSADRFSLDGQRLVCTSGTHYENGSQYRTEIDNFTRVTCYTDGSHPIKFLAETKGGIDIEYGYDSDADQTVEGLTPEISWYANKMTDVYGNKIEFNYIKDEGHNYLGEIIYGPNTVTFFYKERQDNTISYLNEIDPDPRNGYKYSGKLNQRLILDRVEMEYNGNLVKKYQLKYNYPTSNYTRNLILNEIIEYGIGGSRFNSTAFSYQTPDAVSFSQTRYNTSHSYVTYKSKLVTGDYNGDGLSDFLCIPVPGLASWTGIKVYYGDGNDNFIYGFSETTSMNLNNLRDVRSLDINGDGYDDVLYEMINSGTSTFYYMLFNGSSFSSPVTITTLTTDDKTGLSGKYNRVVEYQENDNENSITGADYNGDGINDIFLNSTSGYYQIFTLATTSGQLGSSLRNVTSSTSSNFKERVLTVDFNGNGKSDIWCTTSTGTTIYELDNTNRLAIIYQSSWPTNSHYFTLGDFNRDGKTDMFAYGYSTYDWSDWQVRISTGTGFETQYIPKKKSNLKDDYVRLGDFNGDGATDLMVSSSDQSWSGTYFYVTKNGGTDFYTNSLPSYPSSSHKYNLGDYNGDGRTDFMCTDGVSPYWNGYQMYRAGSKNRILMEKVANGLNQLTRVAYKTLAQNGAPYTKGSGASFPVFDFQGALTVVSSVQTDNGRGSQNTMNYTYEGAKIHRQGKGFLCYSKQIVKDVANNMSTESNYGYSTSYYYPKLTSTVNKAGTTTMSTVSNSWTQLTTANGVYTRDAILPYVFSSTQTNSLTGHSITQTASYDTYGNPTQIAKSYNNGVTETTTNVFSNDATNWLIGKNTSTSISYAKSGETTITRTISKTYYTDGILKPDFVKYYEGTNFYRYVNHDYYSNGNLKQQYEYGTGVGARQTNYTYETNKVRLKTINDPMGHVTTKNYDTYGRLSSEVDYLSNTTSYTYDNMGRVATETLPDGFVTTNTYGWGLTGGPGYACYYVQQSGNDGSLTRTWYDELAREIRNDLRGFSGSNIYTVTEYNTKGQLYRVSEPSTSTSPSQWTTNTYDSYGRIDYIDRHTGRDADYSYSSNRVTQTTAGKTSYKETDSQGLMTLANDNGGSISYAYYPDGNVKTITAPGNVITSMEYEVTGQQKKLVDPSAGTIEYTYSSFGELKTQKNARNQTSTFNYHTDGRLSSKVTPEGTTSYTYNTNEQLTGISSPGSVSKSFTYDTKGRVSTISETIPGSSVFSTTFTYDTKGRLSTRTHPSGVVETNNYNSYGYLSSISAGGSTRWTVTNMNARQQITGSLYGSNLTASFGYDSYGYPDYVTVGSIMDYEYTFDPDDARLTYRSNDKHTGCTESFEYDNLDRLDRVYRGGITLLDMAYESNGNITTKSDVGTNVFEYNHASKPYALTDIETSSGLISQDLQTITYTSFEQVSTIDEGDYYATFTYNSDDQRAKMVVTDLGSTILTRWYVGSRYMKETEGSTTKEYTYIGGDAYSAPVVAVKEGSTTSYYYLLRDYLGNITHQVNTSNSVVAEYSYDAWGRRRVADDWDDYNISSEPGLLAGRGFTGHEHLTYFNLVNMNGRLYDPVVGRFLSPDENLQMPGFTQNFNRYSYALNNPLLYTDPNGESFLSALASGLSFGLYGLWQHNNAQKMGYNGFQSYLYAGGQTAIAAASAYLGSVVQIYGAIPSALFQSSVNVISNGLVNTLNKDPFFENWESGAISGVIFGGISGYQNAQNVGANPWTGKLYQNEITYPSTLKTGIAMQPNPERDCYGYALEYADNGHENRPASYFLGKGNNAPGAYAGDVARKSGIKVNWSSKISGAEWDNVGGSLLQGKEILATTSRGGVNHWVNITRITTADKWRVIGGGWKRVLRSTSVWDPIKGHVNSGPTNLFSVLSLF